MEILTSDMTVIIALAVILVLIVICFVLNFVNSSKINTLLDYTEDNDGDLITALEKYYNKVDNLSKTIHENSDTALLERLTECERQISISYKKAGIVNYNAYDDVTGNQSFSLALLNSVNDGFIFTSLFGNNSCNTYIRRVINGEANVKLLDEERMALKRAISGETAQNTQA